jgi:hypothetical protein
MEVDPKKWRRWLFYIDIVVVAVLIIAIVLLAQDAYYAGYYHGNNREVDFMWKVARDVAFVTGALAWLFYRFFKNEFEVLRHPW